MVKSLVFGLLFSAVHCLLLGIPRPVSAAEPVAAIPAPEGLDPELVRLGERLFHDVRLSANNSVSCAHCHHLGKGGSDNLQVSVGIEGRLGNINSPTVYNTSFHLAYFWDGRAATLEDLILDGPLQNPNEMGSNWREVLGKLGEDDELQRLFDELFAEGLTAETVAQAIATFLRSLSTTDAPFDRWLKGDESALTEKQKRGYHAFKRYGCISCHQGVNLGGNMYAPLGIMGDYFADRGGEVTAADLGRYNVTGRESDRHRFKVPSLRLVTLTAPYFHDGRVETLEEAVSLMARYQLGRELPEQRIEEIVAFLHALVGRHRLLGPDS